MEDTDLQSAYDKKLSSIMDKYDLLSGRITRHFFPLEVKFFEWLPDYSNWSSTKIILFVLFMPYALWNPSFGRRLGKNRKTLLGLFLFSFFYWFTTSMVAYSFITNQLSNSAIGIHILLMINVLFLPFGIIPILQGLWFMFRRGTNADDKSIYGAALLLIGYFFTYPIIRNAILAFKTSGYPKNYLLIEIFLSWIPISLIISMLLFFVFKFLHYFVMAIAFYILEVNFPFHNGFIRELILEGKGNTKEEQNLISLELSEIKAIKARAQSNLENAEKKNIPITIGIGILAILFTLSIVQEKFLEFAQNYVNTVKAAFSPGFHLSAFIGFFVVILSFLGAVYIILNIFTYFLFLHKIIISSILIEACILAEYVKAQTEIETKHPPKMRSPLKMLFQWFFTRR